MLVNDNRQCAQQVNEQLQDLADQPQVSFKEKPTWWTTRASMFGHFDSRGGSTVIVGQRSLQRLHKYHEVFEVEDDCDLAMEDLVSGRAELYFFGGLPEADTELLRDFDGEYLCCRVQPQFAGDDLDKWTNMDSWVFVKPPKTATEADLENFANLSEDEAASELDMLKAVGFPSPRTYKIGGKDFYRYRLVPDSLGEDAWGCIFVQL